MISYVTLGVRDIAAARKFYGDLLGELGAKTLLNMDRITFFGKSMKIPLLALTCAMPMVINSASVISVKHANSR